MPLSVARFGALGDKFLDDTFSEFKHSISIYSLVRTDDTQGGYTTAWELFATVDAFVFTKDSGFNTEKIDADRLNAQRMVRFQLKPITGISEEMKITHKSNDYQIRSINNIADVDQWMIIDTEKGVAQ